MTSNRFRGTQRELYEIGRERRGRPRRGNVKISCKLNQVALQKLDVVHDVFPQLHTTQSELVGLGIDLLSIRMEKMSAVLGKHDSVLPSGIVDLEALYLFWDIKYSGDEATKTTTIYLSPEQTVRLGELRTRLRLQIRVNRDDLLSLGLELLVALIQIARKQKATPLVREVVELEQYLSEFV